MRLFEFLFKYPYKDFAQSDITFTSAWPIEARLAVACVFGLIAWWLYRQVAARLSLKRRWLLVAFRWGVLALVFFMISLPALRARPSAKDDKHDSYVAVMVDVSRSMTIADATGGGGRTVSRIDAARDLLEGDNGLGARFGKRLPVLYFTFDNGARRVTKVDYAANGVETSLFKSLRDFAQDVRALPIAGMVMLSDGCHNAGGAALDGARLLNAEGIRLYAVGLGAMQPPGDYDVMQVIAPDRVRRNIDVEVRAIIRHTDYPGAFKVEIVRNDKVVKERRIEPKAGMDIEDIRISFNPEGQVGTAVYKVRVPPAEDEQLKSNNEREFTVDIVDDRLPVLYVEGSPRFEYRFLRHSVSRDRDFRVVGMLRLADKRVYVQGADETEKVTSDGKTEKEYLKVGFPDTAEKLNRFQALILGDIEASYFTAAQQKLIRDFVVDRGGGLLMLGGVNAFGSGGYAGTPIGDLLPVKISGQDGEYIGGPFKPTFEMVRLKHPAMRLVEDDVANLQLWRNLPELLGLTPVGEVKAGASLLISRDPEAGVGGPSRPVLAAHRAGMGRVAAFMSGGSWYWQMSVPAQDQFHEKFWKQMLRWLAVGAHEQLTVKLDRRVCNGSEPVLIEASVMGRDLEPVSDAEVTATVTNSLNNAETLTMEPVLARPGVYQTSYTPGQRGRYSVTVELKGKQWEQVKPVNTGFVSVESVIEFSDAGQKRSLLEKMAEMTGGRYVTPDRADEILGEINKRLEMGRNSTAQRQRKPLWDMPVLFLAMLILLGAEWVIRRRGELS